MSAASVAVSRRVIGSGGERLAMKSWMMGMVEPGLGEAPLPPDVQVLKGRGAPRI
jgi:hypothetical protein